MERLTKAKIDNLPAPSFGQVFLWDTEVRNFGVRATGGGAKTFVIRYRNADGRSRRMGIGSYGALTLDQARALAKMRLGEVAFGRDPADERSGRRGAPTVGDVCDWYLAEADSGRLLGRRGMPIKPSTLYMDRSRIDRHIKPLIGTRKVAGLKMADIAIMQADIAEGKTLGTRRSGRGRTAEGGSGAASRTVSTIHSIFAHALRMGIIDVNPAAGIRRIASKRRDRRLSVAEIVRFGQAMHELASFSEAPKGLALIRLIALSGFRLNEAQGLERKWVDEDARLIIFPDTKSGAQRRAIGSCALAVIRDQPRPKSRKYVFPADGSDFHYRQGPDVLVRICAAAKIDGVTAHTLRHTFGSVAGDLGFSELTIAAMLGHGKRGVTQGYIHVDEGLRVAIECTSSVIADLLDGRAQTVTPFATLREAHAALKLTQREAA